MPKNTSKPCSCTPIDPKSAAVRQQRFADGGPVRGSIKATPRGKVTGALSDAFRAVDEFAGNPFGYQNPPGHILSSLIGLPDIAKTLDRLSYGEPLTTGAGMTTRPRDEALNAAMTLAPWIGPTARGAAATPRTARNVGRVIKGTDPMEAALAEITRVNSPVERAAASSPRGWVGPVEIGDMESVAKPRSSMFAPASSVTHTHPRTSEFGSYSPLSPSDTTSLEGRNVDMNVVHTVRETGAPSKYRETLKAGSLPPEARDGESIAGYVARLDATPGYTSNVPGYLRPEGTLRTSDYVGDGLSTIKAPGGNWLSGSVEDALKGLKREPRYTHINDQGMAVATGYGRAMTPDELLAHGATPSEAALNNWVDKQLTRYVKNDMATPNDPIRALAEKGPIHFQGNELQLANDWVPENLGLRRMSAGFPVHGVGVSDSAKGWESIADQSLHNLPAGMRLDPEATSVESARKLSVDNPWLTKVPPETMTYGAHPMGMINDLGFEHLMDELRNATSINSGLPAHLRLDPESLARVSVPQAVERVAKINDWRAAQKVEADLARANNAAMVLHKDYPGKGFKWVELKKPDQLPEGWSEELVDTDLGKLRKLRDPKTGGLTATDPREEALRDALKYEGDTMGHCVGGYCDDVASGKSRIYSLRDAKGQPHTTIEVAPYGPHNDDIMFAELTDRLGRQPTKAELAEAMSTAPQRIVQIKGKGNKAPNPEYLPYVQDFVKSGKWSDVGDLQNSGLVKHPSGYLTPEELQALGQAPQGFADGGSVQCYEDGGSVGGASSDGGGWGSASYGNSIAGMNFAGGVSTGQYGSPTAAAEAFTANPDGTYSLADTVQRAGLSEDDAATLAAVTNLTQGDLASINAAHDLGYRADPADQSWASKLGIIPGMSQDTFFSLQDQVPGAQDARMTAFNNYVTAPLAQALMAATPLGTMVNAASAFNSYNDTGDTNALQNFAGGMLGNFAGAKAAQLTGMRALSPMVSSAIKGAVKGGADGAASGAVDGARNAAASTVNSYTAATLANAMGISPQQANALLGLTGASQAVGSTVKGALSRAVR